MKHLRIAGNPYTYLARHCAFTTESCNDPGSDINLLDRITKRLNVSYSLVHFDGWYYENNESALSLLMNGQVDTILLRPYMTEVLTNYKMSWPVTFGTIYPIVKAPSKLNFSTYDFMHSFQLNVWLSLLVTCTACYLLKKLVESGPTNRFPLRNIYHVPLIMSLMIIVVMLNLFSNKLSIILSHPGTYQYPFKTWTDLRSALLAKKLTFVEVSDNNYYIQLLNMSDIVDSINIVKCKRGEEILATKMVSEDASLVSIVFLDRMTGNNMIAPLPLEICAKLEVIRDNSFQHISLGYIFNKSNTSWLYNKLEYSFVKPIYATFVEEVKRLQPGQPNCYYNDLNTYLQRSESRQISFNKSKGIFALLFTGCAISVGVVVLEWINMKIMHKLRALSVSPVTDDEVQSYTT